MMYEDYFRIVCSVCNGTGKVGEKTCSNCYGRGNFIFDKRSFHIRDLSLCENLRQILTYNGKIIKLCRIGAKNCTNYVTECSLRE